MIIFSKRYNAAIVGFASLVAMFGCADLNTSATFNQEQTKTMQIAPYGSWASPISASLAAESSKGLAAIALDGEELYWLETRPLEGGRSVLMRADGSAGGLQITPDGMNLRTRVHEYGGASFVIHRGKVYFSNFADQALYVQEASSGAKAIRLSKDDDLRFADCEMDDKRNRLICVREDHRADGEPSNALVAMDLAGASTGTQTNGQVLWGDSDFVAYPRLNPAGDQLAWISWDHPNMPWDNVALWVADISADGELNNARRLNLGVDESVMQPTWAVDGTLYLLSDRSGWWNLHRLAGDQLLPVHNIQAELGGPLWGLGANFFALVSQTSALVDYHDTEGSHLAVLSLEDGTTTAIDLPFSGYGSLHSNGDTAYVLAGRTDQPGALVEINLGTGEHKVLVDAGVSNLAADYVSYGQAITFPTANNQQAYAYYYPPTNGDYAAPQGELAPLLVLMHGGPTGATGNSFSVAKQYWTTRGIAIIDVNYRGSTGYGREYRQKLNGQWGVVDLEDAVAATEYLVDQGLADPKRLLIRGGSAGGYTTLSALAFTDVFAAGANYFGVADLEALAKDTHKFESRYLDSMVGPYPQMQKLYAQRSPINALSGFNAPLITFQGAEDRIVPPEQSRMIYAALKEKGTATAYIEFPGEQHGFRKAENNIVALESELYFYGKVLGFEPSGELPEVEIDNLDP